MSIKSNGMVRGAAVAKAGRVLSKANYDALTKARDEITRVLESAEVESEGTPKDVEDSAKSQATNDIDVEDAKIPVEPEEKSGSMDHVRALLELSAMSQQEEN